MKQKYILIYLVLLVSLFIYLFYRTEKTLVTGLFIRIISPETYAVLKTNILAALPLNDVLIYSLPEGLWVFCITITSKPYYIKVYKLRIQCLYMPLIFCFSLEIFQLFNITNGRFDFMDLLFCLVFWILGRCLYRDKVGQYNLFSSRDIPSVVCLASYSIVYLAHVFN